MTRTILAALLTAALALPVMADEVWSTPYGNIVYEADLDNDMAVFSYPLEENNETGPRGRMFIEDLAYNYEDRSVHSGFWIEPNNDYPTCPVAITHPETGEPSWNWGQLEVIFLKPDYPTGFVVRGGSCFDALEEDVIVAEPVLGE